MLQVAGLILVLLITNLVLLSPLNLASSTRRLIEKLGRKNLFRNYTSAVIILTFTQVAVAAVQILVAGGEVCGTGVFWLIGISTVGVTALYALIIGILLPWKGMWKPSEGDEVDGRIVIVLISLLYAASVAAFSLLFMVLAIAFFFPG